jgi:RNA polymerase sigma-70 factor (ECF subfamily)
MLERGRRPYDAVVRTDEELMAAYVAGDAQAFREIFQRYAPVLTRMLARKLRAPELANDLVQQTFLQLHRARLDFDPERRFKPWIFTIALNLQREYFRASGRRPETSLEPERAAEIPSEERNVARWEAGRDLALGLARIRPEQREVIELHWFDGLTFVEVGQCLGVSTNAVKVRAHRGYAALRQVLAGDEVSTESEAGNREGASGI